MTAAGKSGLIGEVREIDGVSVVHVEDVYPTDIDDLWAAITEPERLVRWIAQVDGDLQLGGSFTTRFTSQWAGAGRVDVCEAPHHLVVTMEEEGTADEGQIEAWLSTEAEGTRLVIQDRGVPREHAPDHAAGWHVHFSDLRAVLEGREPRSWHDQWVELQPDYRQP